jgi:type I restriction enzyme S subunit
MDLVKIQAGPEIASDYLYGILRFSAFSDLVKQQANGANVLHLNPSLIEQYEFPLAPAPLRDAYAELVGPLFAASDLMVRKNANLRTTRDLLLPKLVSGEIPVEAAAELMEQTA